MRLARIRTKARRTVIEPSTWKYRVLASILLASAIGFLVWAVFASPLWWQIFLALCALPFAFCAFLGFTLFSQTSSLLSITDDGLEFPFGFLSWDEIERVDFTNIAGSASLGIWTYDPYVIARRGRHWWLWVLAFLSHIQRIPQYSFTNLTAPIDELYLAIESRRNPTRTPPDSHGTGSVTTSPAQVRYTDD